MSGTTNYPCVSVSHLHIIKLHAFKVTHAGSEDMQTA